MQLYGVSRLIGIFLTLFKLVQLARAVNKPQTPDQSAPRAAQRRSVRRTPGAGRLNPRPPAKSPHTIRAIEQRTATPGRGRRKSGKYRNARETPRDLLRALSRRKLLTLYT